MSTMAFVFVLLFGIAAVVGLGLAWFWARVVLQRVKVIEHPWHDDRYTVVASAFALIAGGQATIDVFRLIGNIEFGLSRVISGWTGWGVMAGMLVLLSGLFTMVWLADLETNPRKWTWLKRAAAFTVFWSFASFFLHTMIPIFPER